MRTDHALDTAEVRPGPAEGEQRETAPGTSLRIVFSETAATLSLGLEVGAGSSFRMRKGGLPAPPAALGGGASGAESRG